MKLSALKHIFCAARKACEVGWWTFMTSSAQSDRTSQKANCIFHLDWSNDPLFCIFRLAPFNNKVKSCFGMQTFLLHGIYGRVGQACMHANVALGAHSCWEMHNFLFVRSPSLIFRLMVPLVQLSVLLAHSGNRSSSLKVRYACMYTAYIPKRWIGLMERSLTSSNQPSSSRETISRTQRVITITTAKTMQIFASIIGIGVISL